MSPFARRRLLVLPFAALLAACASTPPQATVQVFTGQPQLAAGTTYRFERLPSQAGQPTQAELEATADALLSRAGLRRDDAAPRLAVQVSAFHDRVSSGYGGWGGWGGPSVGIGIGGGSHGGGIGVGVGFPIGGRVEASQRVDVQMRDLTTGQVVYQSQANGSTAHSPSALLEAALRDFPNAPPGARTVPLAGAAPR